jgi:hypothetical protein
VRSVVAVLGIYVLALLLAGTFPVAAGDAVHGGALLHPAFPHSHGPSEASPATPSRELRVGLGPALDASAGGATEIPAMGLTPPVPRSAVGVLVFGDERLVPRERPRPIGRLEPPPDPPPPTSSVGV